MVPTGRVADGSQSALGTRVRRAIKSAGINHSEVARNIGLEPSKLSKSLAGTRKFRVEEISRIAALTNVTTDWLTTGRTGEPPRRGIIPSFQYLSPADAANSAADPDAGRTEVAPAEPWLSKGHRNRLKIVSAAWELYADRGIDHVRTHDIATACGLTVSAINYHFKTKTQLLEAALRYSLEIIAGARDLTAPDDPVAALRHFARIHAGIDTKVRRVWSIWLQSWARAAVEERSRLNLTAVYTEWLDMITGVIAAGQERGTIRTGNTVRMVKSLSIFIDGLGIARSTGQMPITDEEALDLLEEYLSAHILTDSDDNGPGATMPSGSGPPSHRQLQEEGR